ncbi:MAG: hypothetical protein HY043_13595 [Verrucomicrobia bacterium]|nr:hypothetical protein [Verrucomicrobiota bacterium]
MLKPVDARRRWWGTFFLTVAAGLLIWGQTILKPNLKGASFLVYWAFCFVFTGLAIFTALLDVRAVRRQIHKDHRKLVERAIADAKSEMDENEKSSNERGDRPNP